MPKGKFGLPRPFSEYRLVVNPHKQTEKLIHVGPLGEYAGSQLIEEARDVTYSVSVVDQEDVL